MQMGSKSYVVITFGSYVTKLRYKNHVKITSGNYVRFTSGNYVINHANGNKKIRNNYVVANVIITSFCKLGDAFRPLKTHLSTTEHLRGEPHKTEISE